MKASRFLLTGGSIAAASAWAHFATEGLISAAGLFIAIFTLLVIAGVSIAALTEDIGAQTWASMATSIRRARHRRSVREVCSVCARAVVDNGPVRVCPNCDRIPSVTAA